RRGAKNRTDSDERPRGDGNPLADNEADPRPMIQLLAGLGLLRDHVTLWSGPTARARSLLLHRTSLLLPVPARKRIEEVTSIVRLPRPSLKTRSNGALEAVSGSKRSASIGLPRRCNRVPPKCNRRGRILLPDCV